MSNHTYINSESVTEGHPDKMADAISDAILDELLAQDPSSRVACETLITTGLVHIAGEITTEGYADVPTIVRNKIIEIGYDSSLKGFDGNSCGISVSLDRQSPDIARGVDNALERIGNSETAPRDKQGAGDQGMMYGYACSETPELMPLPIMLAHKMAEKLTELRKNKIVNYLRPDGKTQVSIRYENGKPKKLETIVISAQHEDKVAIQNDIARDVREYIIKPLCYQYGLDTKETEIYTNPTGRFVIGGPMADAGLTGRKIIVDTYGGAAHHGGGAFSGKDPSKVDRSAAYAMRWIAKNIVAAQLAERCEVQVAYAIGKAHPVSISIDTFGTEQEGTGKIIKAIEQVFDLRPAGIIKELDLLRPIYSQTSAYGHFGRELPDFTWERTDRVKDLRQAVGW